jgi:hypothetical protein
LKNMVAAGSQGGFAGNVARALVALAGLALLALLALDSGVREAFLTPRVTYGFVLDGAHFRVDRETAERMAERSSARAALGPTEAEHRIRDRVAGELDALFAGAHARLPDLADWYFSMPGEYARLSMWLLQQSGLGDGDYVAARTMDLLFDGNDPTESLARIEELAAEALAAHASEMRAAWLAELIELAEGSRPASRRGSADLALQLDALAGEFGGQGDSQFLARVSTGSASAVASAAMALGMARLGTRAGGAALAGGRASTRIAGQGFGKLGAAGAGSLGCAAAGPAALGCVVLAATATWVAADWALLEIDEWQHRDERIAGWEAQLVELRVAMEEDLLRHYQNAIAEWRDALEREVDRSFSPLAARRVPVWRGFPRVWNEG